MSRAVAVSLISLTVVSCSESVVSDTTAIQGYWRIAEEHGPPLPAECHKATFEIDATTITMRSGTLAVSARYRVVEIGGGWRIEQSSLKHNGGANCQGLSADHVLSRYVRNIDVDFLGDRLRIYDLSRDYDIYADYYRENVAQEPPDKN